MKDWSALDKQYVWHPFTQMQEWLSDSALVIEKAEGNYLIDVEGRRYLDGISSLWVNIHGHRRKEIDDAVKDQLDRVAHTTLLGLASTPSIELAERLVNIMPEGLNKVFYSDSGSTAVEVAVKIAFQYWRNIGRSEKAQFVTLTQAYHGDTVGSVSVGGIDLFHKIFHPLLFHTISVETPFPYRYAGGRCDPDQCRDKSLAQFRSICEERGSEIAALIMEPLVQGAAGMIVHPSGFLKGMEEICREHDILMICDEVATGFGRTGKMFACEHEAVRPDIMAVAKGLSGGYLPLAATVVTDKVYGAFLGPYSEYRTFFHGHSYTGNALACAAANASLDVFEKDRTLERLQPKIALLKTLLDARIAGLQWVGEIRQAGFMVGIELVADKPSGESFSLDLRVGAQVTRDVRRHGVILRPLGDVVVLMPPLSITESELETLVTTASQSIEEVCSRIDSQA